MVGRSPGRGSPVGRREGRVASVATGVGIVRALGRRSSTTAELR